MPGIITHNKVFTESIKLLQKRKKRTYLLKSIDTLFSSPENYKAGLFGCIGPNIFDYIPKRSKNGYLGHKASFFLHNGGSHDLINSMIKKIYSYRDKNNEWSAIQRAYLYGFISHLISDSVIHPFIFYWSGFPDKYNKKEIFYYREQNLLFSYNIDNYYLNTGKEDNFNFNLDSMLPVRIIKGTKKLEPALKYFILDNLYQVYPDIYKEIVWKDDQENNRKYESSTGYLDYIHNLIRLAYKIKLSSNTKLIRIVKFLKRKNIFFSDFIIRYPDLKRVNTHLLNLHKDRWEYPAGQIGLKYESIDNLLNISIEKTVEIWERIESSLWDKPDMGVLDEFNVNAYTGEKKKGFLDMKKKNPLRFYLKY